MATPLDCRRRVVVNCAALHDASTTVVDGFFVASWIVVEIEHIQHLRLNSSARLQVDASSNQCFVSVRRARQFPSVASYCLRRCVTARHRLWQPDEDSAVDTTRLHSDAFDCVWSLPLALDRNVPRSRGENQIMLLPLGLLADSSSQPVDKLEESNHQLVTLVVEQQQVGSLRDDIMEEGRRQNTEADVACVRAQGMTLLVGKSMSQDVRLSKAADRKQVKIRRKSGATFTGIGEMNDNIQSAAES
ncbi:hypothetical protein LSAT2_008977 [Lamellibrachia satsuma]|nr:hypothetical protein LSAT2_008977 [Lamellibrachia satsuma]